MRTRLTSILVLLVLSLVWTACDDSPPVDPPAPDPSCQGLYGSPNVNTGLDTDVCFPRIDGTQTWTPRSWDASALAELLAWTLENPPPVLIAGRTRRNSGLASAICRPCETVWRLDHEYDRR